MKYKPLLVKIMRITFLQFYIVSILAASAMAKDGKAQDVLKYKVSINETNAELGTILKKLENAYDIRFVYSPELVNLKQKVNVFSQLRPLSETLNQLLLPLKLSYEASGEFIVIRNPNDNVEQDKSAAAITITGKVVDEKGEAMVGVAIKLKASGAGTTTDVNGVFAISVPDERAVLVFSFVGYEEQQVVVGNTKIINIVMKGKPNNLNDVVVIGYGSQRKSDVTGSVAAVNPAEIRKTSASDVGQLLQGRVPGIAVTNDGQPGAMPTIRIRGLTTFGNQTPLYVVDGVMLFNPPRDFSPNDIESMQVLKDGTAAAIYGAAAANGVIIITTKTRQKRQSATNRL
jgi:TonB-dependent SusC/RagA subfamily outer membrane receptor